LSTLENSAASKRGTAGRVRPPPPGPAAPAAPAMVPAVGRAAEPARAVREVLQPLRGRRSAHRDGRHPAPCSIGRAGRFPRIDAAPAGLRWARPPRRGHDEACLAAADEKVPSGPGDAHVEEPQPLTNDLDVRGLGGIQVGHQLGMADQQPPELRQYFGARGHLQETGNADKMGLQIVRHSESVDAHHMDRVPLHALGPVLCGDGDSPWLRFDTQAAGGRTEERTGVPAGFAQVGDQLGQLPCAMRIHQVAHVAGDVLGDGQVLRLVQEPVGDGRHQIVRRQPQQAKQVAGLVGLRQDQALFVQLATRCWEPGRPAVIVRPLGERASPAGVRWPARRAVGGAPRRLSQLHSELLDAAGCPGSLPTNAHPVGGPADPVTPPDCR